MPGQIDRPSTDELEAIQADAAKELAQRKRGARPSSSDSLAMEVVREVARRVGDVSADVALLRQEIATMVSTHSARFAALMESQQTTHEDLLRVAREDAERAGQSQHALSGLLSLAETAEARDARREAREIEDRQRAQSIEDENRKRQQQREDEDRALVLEFRRKLLWAFGAAVTIVLGALGLWLGVK